MSRLVMDARARRSDRRPPPQSSGRTAFVGLLIITLGLSLLGACSPRAKGEGTCGVDCAAAASSIPDPTPSLGTCIVIPSGANIQAAVDSYPAATAFCLSGHYAVTQPIVPRDGNVFGGPATLDGGGVTPHAFDGNANHVNDVVIRDLTVQHFDSPPQLAALDRAPGLRWLLERNEVAYNSAVGIEVFSSGTARGNHVHDNGQLGVFAFRADAATIVGNEIDHNNRDLHDQAWEAGGIKVAGTTNLIVRENNVHDNWGKGIWLDSGDSSYLLEANRITNNASSGIKLEKVGSGRVIRNVVTFSGVLQPSQYGGDGINVDASATVQLSANSVGCSSRKNYATVNHSEVLDLGDNTVASC
jgi:parallel beta-helix repeat protein